MSVTIGGDIVITRPKPAASMCGMHACVIANEPRELIDEIRSYFLSGVSTMSCHLGVIISQPKIWVPRCTVRMAPPEAGTHTPYVQCVGP